MNNRPAHAHDSGEDADWLMDPSGQNVFRTVRHGWDPSEVERTLLDLRAERDALVIERDEARLEAAHRVRETPEAPVLDQSALVGEHVATVLRAAEAAAEQLRGEAETRAQDIVRDAEQASLKLLDDAAARMAAAQAEADQLVDRARLQAEENVGAMLIDFDRLKETTQDLHRQLQQAREAAFSGSVARIPESDPTEPTTELAAVRSADEAAEPPTEETAEQVKADQSG